MTNNAKASVISELEITFNWRKSGEQHWKLGGKDICILLLTCLGTILIPQLAPPVVMLPTLDRIGWSLPVIGSDEWYFVQSLVKSAFSKELIAGPGAVLVGGGNKGKYLRNSESGPPCGPPNRESALVIQWQISCNDFVYPIKIAEIVNTVLSEWGIKLFFQVVCAP